MAAYLEKVKAELQNFSRYEIKHVDRKDNSNADALAKLATSKDTELLRLVPVEVIPETSMAMRDLVEAIDSEHSWMDDIAIYLKEDKLPKDRERAQRVRYHAGHYLLVNDKLYKRGVSTSLLRCLNDKEAKEVLSEIYDGVYDAGGSPSHIRLYCRDFISPR